MGAARGAKTVRPKRPGPPATAAALGVLALIATLLAAAAATPAAAAPLRVSLHGTAAPAPASMEPGRAATARFVATDAPGHAASPGPARGAVAGEDMPADAGSELVPALELPLQARAIEPEWPRPDEAQGMLRVLGGGLEGAAGLAVARAERGLGDFSPPSTTAAAQSDVSEDSVQAAALALDEEALEQARIQPAPAGAANPMPESGDADLRRMLILAVVPPLALAATAVLWRLDRGGRRRRRPRRGRRERAA